MQSYEGLKARLVWDGSDEVRIPPEMGTPRPDQLQGTAAERLTELCGRVCYDPATELLTRTGWVRLDQLPRGVEVATYNAATERLEFQLPTDYIAQRHVGPMYRVNTSKVSLFVTPNHRLFVRGQSSGWALRPASEMAGHTYFVRRYAAYAGGPAEQIIMTGRSYQQECANAYGRTGVIVARKVGDVTIDSHQLVHWASLLGYYISEGTLNENEGHGSAPRIAIYQKEETAGPIFAAAEGCGLTTRAYKDKRNGVLQIVVGGSTLALYLKQFGVGSHHKRLPDYVFEWPTDLRETLLAALMDGDGTITDHGTRVYNTISKPLADDVQRLIVTLGRPANINRSECETGTMYRVRETLHRDASVNKHRQQDTFVHYDGEVYCVTVPNHVLVTRRDDKVALCGNCYDSLGVGRSSADYFDHILGVGHLSIAEHFNATVEIRGNFGPAHIMALTNRPWVWVTYVDANCLRITTNVRAAREWSAWNAKQASLMPWFPTAVADAIGLILTDRFHQLAPKIVPAPKDEMWPIMKMVGIESAVAVQPVNNAERWISVYMVGSRGFCYDDKTEVLTDEGWKLWPDVRGTEKFASMTSSGELVYEESSKLTIEDHSGPMYSVRSEQVDLCVTLNHRMWVQKVDTQAAKRGEEQFGIIEAKELLNKRVRYQKGGVIWRGKRPDSIEIQPTCRDVNGGVKEYVGPVFPAEAFAKFLGFYVSEGCLDSLVEGDGRTAIHLSQNTGPVFDEIMETIEEMSLKATVTDNSDGVHGTNKRISVKNVAFRDWLSEHCRNGAPNKRVPYIVGDWSPDLIETFLDALVKGDGNVHANGHVVLYTTSKLLADDVQILALKVGCAANIRVDDRVGESHVMPGGQILTHREVCYVVSFISKSRLYPHVNHNKSAMLRNGAERPKFDRDDLGNCDEFVGYSGKVYCVTVPSGLLYVRRNGRPVWSGNSHEQVRHGDFTAISQRSTRYCEESDSPWVIHPLIQEFQNDSSVSKDDRAMAKQMVDDTVAKCRHAYRWWVDKLVPYVTPRLANDPYAKTTARKQARGAARGLLGNALETEVIFSGAVFQWQHMYPMRCSAAADAEIRNEFVEVLPLLKGSRYGDEFSRFELAASPDGIGRALVGGGNK